MIAVAVVALLCGLVLAVVLGWNSFARWYNLRNVTKVVEAMSKEPVLSDLGVGPLVPQLDARIAEAARLGLHEVDRFHLRLEDTALQFVVFHGDDPRVQVHAAGNERFTDWEVVSRLDGGRGLLETASGGGQMLQPPEFLLQVFRDEDIERLMFEHARGLDLLTRRGVVPDAVSSEDPREVTRWSQERVARWMRADPERNTVALRENLEQKTHQYVGYLEDDPAVEERLAGYFASGA